MAASQNFNTSNKSFRQMFGNGLSYKVPMFQRDYSWEDDQWDDLWNDIVLTAATRENDVHYMGYLVLSSTDSRVFSVIDGQQRLTTLTLLILAVLKYLDELAENGIDPEANRQRSTQLRSSYIGYLDPVTLITQSKLSLNRANDAYFQTYIVPLQPLPKQNLKFSEKLLKNAFEWFYGRIIDQFSKAKSGKEIAQFIENVVDRLFFTVIEVNDELDAFSVFETLNSRGVKLAPIDLLKNYLFSVVNKSPSSSHELETRRLEEQWHKIVDTIGDANLTDFLRVHWNSKNTRVRESGLFKAVRQVIDDRGKVFDLVRNLDADSAVFAAFIDPENELWSAEQRQYIRTLLLFKVKQPLSLLLAARRTLNDADFTKVLRACVIISFRYNIIFSGATGDQETIYNNLAKDITLGNVLTIQDVMSRLRLIYKTDTEFKAAFSVKSFPNNSSKVAIYILTELEKKQGIAFDTNSSKYDLEHIFPVNPADDWPGFPSPVTDDPQLRLGNLTLIEKTLNKNAGNRSFDEKKLIYAQSLVPSTQKIGTEYDSWSKSEINDRQDRMAREATSIWRLSEFD
ncbi:MAG: DUF262 domain-containing protein [Hyphomicrobiales bacterium]